MGNLRRKAIKKDATKDLNRMLFEIVTETENTARRFAADWCEHLDNKRYFRFNVEQGLQQVVSEDYRQQGTIEAATGGYLDHQVVKSSIRHCIRNLVTKQILSVWRLKRPPIAFNPVRAFDTTATIR